MPVIEFELVTSLRLEREAARALTPTVGNTVRTWVTAAIAWSPPPSDRVSGEARVGLVVEKVRRLARRAVVGWKTPAPMRDA